MPYRIALLVIGLALLALGQHSLLTRYDNLPLGLALVMGGLPGVAAAAWRKSLPADLPAEYGAVSRAETPARLRWFHLALLILSMVLAGLAGLCAHDWSKHTTPGVALGLWAGAMMLFVAGTIQPGEPGERLADLRARWRSERTHWMLVAAVMVIGLMARTLALEGYPHPFSFDEGAFAQEAAAIAGGSYRANPFGPAWLSHPRLFHYLMAPFIGLLGRTVTAARLPVALLATLTIPAVYELGRELFGRRTGLAAAIFIAGFNFHVHFSRLALNNAIDPLFGTLAFTWLVRGLRRNRLSDFALAGLALGMSQYFYAGARLLPVIMVAWLAAVLLLRRDLLPGRAAGLLLLIAGLMVATWPADWYLLVTHQPLTTRLDSTGLFQTGRFEILLEEAGPLVILWDQFRLAALALIHTLDSTLFYGQVAPVMGRYAGVPLLLGALYTGLRPRRVETWLPLLWIAGTVLAGGMLLNRPPGYARYVLMVPAAAVLVGVGLTGTLDLLEPLAAGFRRWFPAGLAAGLMAVEIAFYAGVYVEHLRSYGRDPNTLLGGGAVNWLRQELAAHPAMHIYYLVTPRMYLDNSTLMLYFLPGCLDADLPPDLAYLPPQKTPPVRRVYLFSPERYAEHGRLVMTSEPGGTLLPHFDPQGNVLFYTYAVEPAGVTEAGRGP